MHTHQHVQEPVPDLNAVPVTSHFPLITEPLVSQAPPISHGTLSLGSSMTPAPP